MLPTFASPRRIAIAAALASFAAASLVGSTTQAGAFGMHHGGGGGFGGFSHGGFGGFHHEAFHDFHRFNRRFAFGFGGFPGYYDYAYYDGCLRREWGPYGWSFVNICY
jgi:hypothetical protein